MLLTFAFLAWGFWELSGGAGFVPETRPDLVAEAAPQRAAEPAVEPPVLVTRASSMTAPLGGQTAPAATQGDADIIQASLSSPAPAAVPTEDTQVTVQEEAFVFQSLVEGAPTVADILPDSDIAVILPEGTATVQSASAPQVSGNIRQVAGSRVNMRSGPGTNYGVVTTLTGGTDVEVFEVNADGWARLRSVSTGQEGWMAERLLTGG